MTLTIRYVDPADPAVEPLVAAILAEYVELYGELVERDFERYAVGEFSEPDGAIVIVAENDRTVAAGAFRRFDETTAEPKRVWTHPGYRRRGLARRVLDELERAAAFRGYERIYLTTGWLQPPAMRMYLNAGYTPLFDVHADLASIGLLPFEKRLPPSARIAAVNGPHGLQSLTGTHWIADETTVPGVPGVWHPADGGVVLKASAGDGITLDGEPVDGTVTLAAESHAPLRCHYLKLLVIERDGRFAVRVYDPAAPNRQAFAGIDVFPHDPALAVPARYADGKVMFELGGQSYALTVETTPTGYWAVFGDRTNGESTYAFRFLTMTGDVIDFNRAYLPPCAFADHYLCPVPPEGNRLPIAIEAGEKRLFTTGSAPRFPVGTGQA